MALDDGFLRWLDNPKLLAKHREKMRDNAWRVKVLDMVDLPNPSEIVDLDPDLLRLVREQREMKQEYEKMKRKYDACRARFERVVERTKPKENQ